MDSDIECSDPLLNQILDMLGKLQQRCEAIDQKVDTILQSGCAVGGGGGMGGGNFMQIDDKVDYLNQNCKPTIQCSLVEFVNNQMNQENYVSLMKHNIVDILRGNRCIYEVSVSYILKMIEESSEKKWIYAFPFQKYILYVWNQDKISWDKLTTKGLEDLFNMIQLRLLETYSSMVVDIDHYMLSNIDLVESCGNLYVDNFSKKQMDFKKMIFQLFV